MSNPYERLAPEAFWKNAVAAKSAFDIGGLWKPKFAVTPGMPIVTAGSCFAQHIGKALAKRGYLWHDAEPAPPIIDPESARTYNYGIFSFRTGNIYTTRMLRQWLEQAHGKTEPMWEIWQDGQGRCFDPLRPTIEPAGFASKEELHEAREVTYAALRRAVKTARVFIFTLGLTESWSNRRTREEYASCPGTAAGSYDSKKHVFVNHRVDAILADLEAALALLRAENPAIKVLLTVSPVPLTATASGQHVLTATSYSKSTLRAVAGMAAQDHDWVDYFPSYEIINTTPFRGMFFEPNMRSVNPNGVDFVMRNFFLDQEAAFGPQKALETPPRTQHNTTKISPSPRRRSGAVICEEEMLNAFG